MSHTPASQTSSSAREAAPEESTSHGQRGLVRTPRATQSAHVTSPTAVVVPLRGVSAIDAEGKPFWWPEADQALFQSLRNWLSPDVKLIERDLHINDPAFAQTCVETLLAMLRVVGPVTRERGNP